MSYFSIYDNINKNLDIIDELNKTDIIQEINDRDILNEFSNKKKNNNIFVGTIQNYYEFLGYTVLSLLNDGFKKINYQNAGFTISQLIDGKFNRANFITAGYSVNDIINAGFKTRLKDIGYNPEEIINSGLTKQDFDLIGYSVYDFLDFNVSKSILLGFGYSQQILDSYNTFIFQISTKIWDSSLNIPHKYPIIDNKIIDYYPPFLSIIETNNLNDITTITIKFYSYLRYIYNFDYFFVTANDGISLNKYTIPYYKDPSFRIIQFGGIQFITNSAINTNFFQGYEFGGSIDASYDTPSFVRNTSFYNIFSNSTASNFKIYLLGKHMKLLILEVHLKEQENFKAELEIGISLKLRVDIWKI